MCDILTITMGKQCENNVRLFNTTSVTWSPRDTPTMAKNGKIKFLAKDSQLCVMYIPNMSAIGRMLDTFEFRTSLLDPKVY